MTHHQLTWRQAIQKAFDDVEAAKVQRARVLSTAHAAGISVREIAAITPVNHSTIWRWIGGEDGGADAPSLDDPADTSLWGRSV